MWLSLGLAQTGYSGLKTVILKQDYVWFVHDNFHYNEMTQYDSETKTGGLFTNNINTFLKVKVEASGYPADCVTDEEKQKYVDMYLEKEGIALDPEKIEFNPGLRLVAKAALNSLWGRLAKRNNLKKTVFCREPAEFFAIVNNNLYDVCDFHIINQHLVSIEYEVKKQLVSEDKTTNVLLAALVTAYGRLKLYDYLEKLGDAVLYFDTDSIIFLYDPEKPHIDLELGDFLGDLADEVPRGK